MINTETWTKAWALLDARERRNALIVLGVVIVAALSSAAMVGSVMPFLSVLADPSRIQTVPALAWAYGAGGFTSTYGFLVVLGGLSIAVILTAGALQILRTYVVARFATMRMHTLSHRLLASYLRQPYEYFLNSHSGDMGTRILSESQQVVAQFFRPAAELVAAALTVIAVVVLVVWINPVVALATSLVLGGLYGGVFALSRAALTRLGKDRVAANSARYRIATEALGGVKDIKLLGRERAYVDRYLAPSVRMARLAVAVNLISALPQFVMQTVAFCGIIVLCLLLLDPAGLDSGTALGGLLPLLGALAFAGQRILPEIQKVYQGFTQIQAGAAAVDTVHDDLIGKSNTADLPRTRAQPMGLHQHLRLDGVSYRYPNAEKAGLQDVSLTIAAGEKIGIVGSTGAGKTTLADIVLGLLPPGDGTITVDGTVISDDTIRAWQQTVGYVPQDIFLTDATVAENIALGLAPGDIDRARVKHAADIAQLSTFIETELPDGYDTTVGERGVRLSGGQKQRIGIARAMYHDADLIVFDEATSALDNLTEHEVMAAINALPGDKTILMIAHRLSTLRISDQIVVLEGGRLVGVGNWSDLMQHNEAFRRLAQLSDAA